MGRSKSLLFELNICREPNTNLVLLRALIDNEFTRLDFGYIATSEYVRGGWIRISPHTYIKIKGDDKKYTLTHAENIPIAPEHFHFESEKDWQYFSLYFPSIPQETCLIDIIEKDKPDDNDFNYYAVSLDINAAEELIQILE